MAKVIAERKKSEANEEHDDLLQMLIDARYKDTDEGMTDVQLIDEAIILFVAGHETTANAMTWAIYSLLKNPEHYKSLKEEMGNINEDDWDFQSIMAPNLVGQVCHCLLYTSPSPRD